MDDTLSRREFIRVIEVGGVTVTLAGCLDMNVDDLETTPGDTTMQDQQTQNNPKAERNGPMTIGRFEVTIDDVEVAGWQSVTIPSKSIEQDTYREGDDAEYEKKTWGQPTFDDLEMERGVTPGATELWGWVRDIQAGKVDEGRKEIEIKLKNEEGETMLHWEFREAWIKEYNPPDLDASADGELATESITVAFDTMERVEQ